MMFKGEASPSLLVLSVPEGGRWKPRSRLVRLHLDLWLQSWGAACLRGGDGNCSAGVGFQRPLGEGMLLAV